MMIVELIDQDDFRNRLLEIGVPVPAGSGPEQAARIAVEVLATRGLPHLAETVNGLMERADVMHPEVRAAIESHLLPALAS